MSSKTSFIDGTLLKKNMTRFWPLWVTYTVIMLFNFPISMYVSHVGYEPERILSRIGSEFVETAHQGGLVLVCILALLVAMANFSWLYQARSSSYYHALPVRRSSLFLTSYLSGLLMLLIPLVLAGLFLIPAEFALCGMVDWTALGVWFLRMLVSTFFFYSFATFCAVCTGHIVALGCFYVIFNFLAMYLMSLGQYYLSRLLYGYSSNLSEFSPLSPALYIGSLSGSNMNLTLPYLGYALAGAVFVALGILVMRHRPAESAGDVVSMPWMGQFFRYSVAVCGSMGLTALLLGLFNIRPGPYEVVILLAFLVLTGGVSFFAADMIRKKSFRVFKQGTRPWLVFTGAMALVLVLIGFDLIGYETRMPKADEIDSVYLYNYYNSREMQAIAASAEELGSDPNLSAVAARIRGAFHEGENIDLALQAHQQIIADRAENEQKTQDYYYGGGDGYMQGFEYPWEQTETMHQVTLVYRLKNGQTLHREYNLFIESGDLARESTATTLETLYNTQEFRDKAYIPADVAPEEVQNISIWWQYAQEDDVSGYTGGRMDGQFNYQQRQTLLDAMRQDLDSGAAGRFRFFIDEEWAKESYGGTLEVSIYYDLQNDYSWYSEYYSVGLNKSMIHTLAALQELGLVEGTPKTIWESMNP